MENGMHHGALAEEQLRRAALDEDETDLGVKPVPDGLREAQASEKAEKNPQRVPVIGFANVDYANDEK